MAEGSGGARFLLEAPDAIGIERQPGVDHLERDVPFETGVARPVDLAHAARSQRRDDPVASDRGPRFQHRFRLLILKWAAQLRGRYISGPRRGRFARSLSSSATPSGLARCWS